MSPFVQITLFGQSAGAQSTAVHYVTSEMQTFFQRAIIQSAPMTIPFRSLLDNVTPTVLLAEQLHCSPSDLTCFRSRSTSELIAGQTAVNGKLTSLNPLMFFEPWLPVIDNVIIHGPLLTMLHNATFPLKPLIIGTVTDECLDMVFTTWNHTLSSSEYIAVMLALFGKNGFKVVEHYPPSGSGDQRTLLARAATDWVFACSTRVFARRAATYAYVFGYPYDKAIGCPDHACHGDELPFTFESRWQSFTDAGRQISRGMATFWTNFAKSEDPNAPFDVPASWPKMKGINETYMLIEQPFHVEMNYLKNDCDFWDEIGYRKPTRSFLSEGKS